MLVGFLFRMLRLCIEDVVLTQMFVQVAIWSV